MMVGRFLGMVILILWAISPLAFAQEFAEDGAYFVLGGITGFERLDDTSSVSVDDSLGFNMRFGYRFLPGLAAEIEWDFLDGFDLNDVPGNLTVDGWLLTANVKAPLRTDRVQPFLLAGLGAMYAQLRSETVLVVCDWWWCYGTSAQLGDEIDFAMRFGGGLDVYLAEEFAITLDANYVIPTGGLEDLTYISFGWGFLFKYY
ncbi:MAG: outer membrane beta-barrel protein [Deltaproteobacteria bacterium]|nr:outer membrane beta-barrel protein [Deltaproteobacteria bacterium]